MMGRCVICGRKIPEGQGIVLSRGSLILRFHSSKCASKFLRALLESAEEGCLSSMERVAREREKALEAKKTEKKI